MSPYLFCFCLGFAGFVAMTLLGLSHSHSIAKHPHGSHGHGPAKAHPLKGAAQAGSVFLTLLGLPRLVFSLCLGFGAVGMVLQGALQGTALLAAAACGAWVFHRWALTPVWTFLLRFASAPAKSLEDLVLEEAQAVTDFDARGQGLVLVHLDGRAVQILARLEKNRTREALRVRSGDRLSIVAVDPKRNSCTVIPLNP